MASSKIENAHFILERECGGSKLADAQ